MRNVLRNKGLSGAPLTTNPPFGYKKNPDKPKEWLIDEPAAEIVRRIFDMCVEGFGPTQIAKKLKADKVMTPTVYWNSIGIAYRKPPATPYHWSAASVVRILSRQEYIGDTVNFRTMHKSFKSKKRLELPQEEWQIFKNTHPAIIDEKPSCSCRSFGNTAADRQGAGLSACFLVCSIAPTAGRNSITAQ